MSVDTPEKTDLERGPIISRRSFLKGAAYTAVGATMAAGLPPDTSEQVQIHARKSELPSDILTEVDLEKNHITIYPTAHTQLHLRREALKLPIFKDVEEGKLNGVVIALVDSETLSWKSTSNLPEDARSIYQSAERHPREYTEEWWQKRIKFEEDEIKFYQQNLNGYEKRLAKTSSEKKRNSSREQILAWKKAIQASQEKLRVFQDRQKAIDYLSEKGYGQGRYFRFTKEFLDQLSEFDGDPQLLERAHALVDHHPEWSNKVYIYLCVGGKYTPSPDQPFTDPNMYTKSQDPNRNLRSYTVFPKDLPSRKGFILRHELAHYVAGRMEGIADELALGSIEEAWKKYQETGDSSGYAFVFVNKKGVTITKAPDEGGVPA